MRVKTQGTGAGYSRDNIDHHRHNLLLGRVVYPASGLGSATRVRDEKITVLKEDYFFF